MNKLNFIVTNFFIFFKNIVFFLNCYEERNWFKKRDREEEKNF